MGEKRSFSIERQNVFGLAFTWAFYSYEYGEASEVEGKISYKMMKEFEVNLLVPFFLLSLTLRFKRGKQC